MIASLCAFMIGVNMSSLVQSTSAHDTAGKLTARTGPHTWKLLRTISTQY